MLDSRGQPSLCSQVHKTVTDEETVLNCLSPKGLVHRDRTEGLSLSLPLKECYLHTLKAAAFVASGLQSA